MILLEKSTTERNIAFYSSDQTTQFILAEESQAEYLFKVFWVQLTPSEGTKLNHKMQIPIRSLLGSLMIILPIPDSGNILPGPSIIPPPFFLNGKELLQNLDSNPDEVWSQLKEAASKYESNPPNVTIAWSIPPPKSKPNHSVLESYQFDALSYDESLLEFVGHDILSHFTPQQTNIPSFRDLVFRSHLMYRHPPYHGWYHAIDVLQFMSLELSIDAVKSCYTDKEILTAIVASLLHDIDHDGVTNKGHIALDSERYHHSAESVQEKHHMAISDKLLSFLQLDQYVDLELLNEIITKTDMAVHNSVVKEFVKEQFDLEKLKFASQEKRYLFLIVLMKAADLSNTVRTIPTSRSWGNKLGAEFQAHWSRECSEAVPIERRTFQSDPILHHDAVQQSFFEKVIVPFFEALNNCPILHPFMDPFYKNALESLDHWTKISPPSTSKSIPNAE